MGIAQGLGLCIVALVTGVVPMASPAAAQQSVPLFPAQVSGPNIDCLFSPQCALTPHDEFTEIPLPAISGKAILHSRTFLGAPGSNAAGRTAYQFRIDLTDATALADVSCVLSLSTDFGPVAKLPYAAGTTLRDVYEIVQGVPSNQIGFATAVQTGTVVTFTFTRPICAADAGGVGNTSFSFGLASLDAPVRGVHVQIEVLGLDLQVKSFGPRR
jgi:hypothetical protein